MKVDFTKHDAPKASRYTCFLCGTESSHSGLGQEHVFAKWLLNKFKLWDSELVLLNRTRIPYRNLKTPACPPCNNISLSKVEKKVARGLQGGASEIRALGHEILYLWTAKIYFGTLYAEALLPNNRAGSDNRAILGQDSLDKFRFLHLTMQAARTNITFSSQETNYHSSILVFQVQEHPNPAYRFMYRDDFHYGCIAIRLNTVGIICITDGGAQERLAKEIFPRLFEHSLHPLQFEEITARVFMKARTLTRKAQYISSQSPNQTMILQMPLSRFSESRLFGDYDHKGYAHMLADFTNHPVNLIWMGNGLVHTWIRSYETPHFIDIHKYPWP